MNARLIKSNIKRIEALLDQIKADLHNDIVKYQWREDLLNKLPHRVSYSLARVIRDMNFQSLDELRAWMDVGYIQHVGKKGRQEIYQAIDELQVGNHDPI